LFWILHPANPQNKRRRQVIPDDPEHFVAAKRIEIVDGRASQAKPELTIAEDLLLEAQVLRNFLNASPKVRRHGTCREQTAA
jgi:hypothetical protein